MSKMTIMQGLPASGKSTRAEEIRKTDGNGVRINKDLLRKMLHFGHWSGKNEDITRDAARVLAKHFLSNDTNVIIDDTNLNEGTLQSWKDLATEVGSKHRVIRLDTSLEVCIARDIVRPDSVGEQVIIGMAMQSQIYPKPEKGIVICDIDGTLADAQHRVHLVQGEKKDWKQFFSLMHLDTPRMEVIDKVMELEGEGHQIILVSGRPEEYRDMTEAWLERTFKGYRPYRALFMRKTGDSRPDDQVKQQIYDTYFKDKYPVHSVIDDRPSVIRMWRANGLTVDDVGNGKEF